MSAALISAARAAMDALDDARHHMSASGAPTLMQIAAQQAIRAALAAAEAQPTDAYSHLAEALGCDPMDSHDARIGRALTARLALEAQPAATALTQLSDAALEAAVLADETLRHYFALNGGSGPVSSKGVKVFRAIERAHGIGECS